ncbi:ankyrin repeat, SAM and basic leucine zipper domain-containing protein 1 [Arctopsyche grandis]|uniref:ankyrin repeat, SAM and basic leucine zipper domain-containing protein 1 n=1 Tax=Arctopsyche grandis TaxID=121162 RepID=UPI00406D662E
MNSAPLLDYDSDYDGFDSDDDEYSRFAKRTDGPTQPPIDPHKELRSRIQSAACEGNVLELQDAILNNTLGITIDSPLDGIWTALMYGCTSSQPDIVDFLLKNGANPNITESQSALNPLLCACLSKSINTISNEACVKLLLGRKTSVNVMDKFRQTPLMISIEASKTYVAAMLIPHAKLEMRDLHGRTALYYAVLHKRHLILKQLMAAGASLKVVDRDRLSIKDLALNKNHKPTLKVLKDFLTEESPKHESKNEISYEVIIDWKEMYPGILCFDKPAYWHEIPRLLYGMHCEKLIPKFESAKMDLFTFLTMTDIDMNVLTDLPYLRNRLMCGLLKFHVHRWSVETVSGYPSSRKDEVDYTMCLSYFGSHMAQVTVIKSSFCYLNKILNTHKVDFPPKLDENIGTALLQIKKAKMELERTRQIIQKVNKLSVTPPDLILPQKKSRSSKKRYFYYTMLIAVCVTVTVSFKLKRF